MIKVNIQIKKMNNTQNFKSAPLLKVGKVIQNKSVNFKVPLKRLKEKKNSKILNKEKLVIKTNFNNYNNNSRFNKKNKW